MDSVGRLDTPSGFDPVHSPPIARSISITCGRNRSAISTASFSRVRLANDLGSANFGDELPGRGPERRAVVHQHYRNHYGFPGRPARIASPATIVEGTASAYQALRNGEVRNPLGQDLTDRKQ